MIVRLFHFLKYYCARFCAHVPQKLRKHHAPLLVTATTDERDLSRGGLLDCRPSLDTGSQMVWTMTRGALTSTCTQFGLLISAASTLSLVNLLVWTFLELL